MKFFSVAQLALAAFLFSSSATIAGDEQSNSDTTVVETATISALRIPTPEDRVSGNVHRLNAEALQNGKSPDLEDALNSLPGVRMETRGFGGSRRLQIRSSGIRAPFAVRNVHMLMDGFVLTNASGISPLDTWNPQWMAELEVLKGPVGAIYGSGYGGVLLGQSLHRYSSANASQLKGYSRIASNGSNSGVSLSEMSSESGFQWQSVADSIEWTMRGFWSETPGGRLHESNGRKQVEVHRRKANDRARFTHLWLGWMDASWDLPGSLNASDAANSPAQSPGGTYDAHVDRMRSWLGYSSVRKQSDKQSGLWVYLQHSDKENPFGTSAFFNGYKDESEQFSSVRWWTAKSKSLGNDFKLTWDKTAILRAERLSLKETDLPTSTDTYRYNIESITTNAWASSGGRLENDNWQFDVQIALKWMQRSTEGEGSGNGSIDENDYLPIVENYAHLTALPYFGLSRKLNDYGRVFLQYGKAASHPTTFELVDPDNYTALNLSPERANAIELGWKGEIPAANSFITYSLQAYQQLVSDAIASVPAANDGVYVDNIEGLKMTGIEAFFQTNLNLANQHTLHLQTQASLNRHSFEQVAETLPGTPLHASSFLVAYAAKKWTISAMHYWNDQMPLHNSKDDWSNAHQRLDAWLSLQSRANVWQFGVRNVLNAQYSSWFQTNAFGGRYFNPAPGRLIWLSWKWQIN